MGESVCQQGNQYTVLFIGYKKELRIFLMLQNQALESWEIPDLQLPMQH